ncbi:unnamed protein product [Parajaminaea phylloscopi]
MRSTCLAVLSAAAAAILVSASPLPAKRSGYPNGITIDAPFSQTDAQFAAVPLVCPYGVQQAANKNMLFIEGTGETGEEAFSRGYLPAFHAQGLSPCYANLPNRSLSDAQVTSEYVVKLIDQLYARGGNQEIVAVGHSQGNLNIQWALNFWPSRRSKVGRFVSLSGDFHGTEEGILMSAAQSLLAAGSAPATIQQSVVLGKATNFLQALSKHGNTPLVPTTSVYGIFDEVIQPVVPTTNLDNVPVPNSFSHIDLSAACAGRTAAVVDHFRTLLSAPAFWIALDAINKGIGSVAGGQALATQQKQDFCSDFVPGAADDSIPATVKASVIASLEVLTNDFGRNSALMEPPLKAYAANQ